jgi:hypothetical protein
MNNLKKEVRETRPPTQAEERWFEYIDNLPFKSDEYLTTFAEKLLGLNTAVIAAYIAGLKLAAISLSAYVFIPILMFILSLFCCLYSIYPKIQKSETHDLSGFKEKYVKGIFYRHKTISISFISYFIGIVVGVAVIVFG